MERPQRARDEKKAPVKCPIVSVFATLLWRRAVSNKAEYRAFYAAMQQVSALARLHRKHLFTKRWQLGHWPGAPANGRHSFPS
jgi:hypothetical protein